MRAAKDPTVDAGKVRELYLIAREIRQDEAMEAFNVAMSACQAEMRPIAADAENPQTHSRYATYAKLDRALRPIYTKHGFAISYDEADSDKPAHVRVLAYVTRGAYTRIYRKDMPADGKGAKGGDVMTLTHASGAAGSYGSRYLLKGIFNVAVGEEDVDGNEPSSIPETPKGYDSWKADMDVKAEDGTVQHKIAWQGSKQEFRDYAVAHDKGWWEGSKKKAAKAVVP
jgi:hypothetical protein